MSSVLAALEDSTSGKAYASYAALKRFPGGQRFDTVIDSSSKKYPASDSWHDEIDERSTGTPRR
jgi:hypothetical protein